MRRKHLGILEKNKDYKRRSKNYKEKDSVIKKLALKAQMRNPDEFYHKMGRMKKDPFTGKAVVGKPTTKEAKTNMRKVMTIDENANVALVNMRATVEAKKIERLQKNLHMIDFERPSQSVQLISSVKEIEVPE